MTEVLITKSKVRPCELTTHGVVTWILGEKLVDEAEGRTVDWITATRVNLV